MISTVCLVDICVHGPVILKKKKPFVSHLQILSDIMDESRAGFHMIYYV